MFGFNFKAGAETEKAIERIKAGAYMSKAGELEDLLAAARRYKPGGVGYDEHGAKARRMYDGQQIPYVRKALKMRYPKTAHKMTPVALNVLRTIGELDAQAYRQQPERWACNEAGEVDEAATEELEAAATQARLNVVLPEMERRAGVGAGTQCVRVMPREVAHGPGRYEEKVCADLFWGDAIQFIPNPDAPDDLWAGYLLAARISGDDGAPRWEVWFRPASDALWAYEILEEVGQGADKGYRSLGVQQTALSVLPWVDFPEQMVIGSVWSPGNQDLTAAQDAVNVALSNWWHKDDMQGHKTVAISGPQPQKGRELVIGPSALLELPENTTIQTIDADHDMTTLEGLEKYMRMVGMSLRQSPDAWATEPGPPLSGISRIVQNIAPNQKRDERTTLYKQKEESRLLPLLAEVSDAYFGTSILSEGRKFKVRFAPPPDYEEPRAKLDRALMMRDAGLISDAQAAVTGGAYRTLEEAIAAGLSAKIAEKEPVPAVFQPQIDENAESEPGDAEMAKDES